MMMMMNSQPQPQQQQQQQQPPPQQRQLVVVVEGTAALGPTWPLLLAEYVEKIVRAFCGYNVAGQKQAGTTGEMALVVYNSHGSQNGCLLQRSGWTSSIDVFFRWLSSITFMGGGFGDAAVAEGLSEALLMCCPGPNVAPASQGRDLQKHCVLIATSNPCRIARSVPSPPVSNFLQSQVNNGDLQGEQWWLADADTVAQAYPPCSVSLSVLAPRQLPLLRNIFSQARRGGRAAEPAAEPPKQYAQHLVLLSEGFLEAKMALHRSSVVGTNNMPTGLAAKVEHQPVAVATSTASGQISGAGPRPSSAVPPGSGVLTELTKKSGIGVLTGRPGPNMPIQPVTVKMEAGTTGNLSSLLHNNNTNNTLPLPMQQLPSSGPVSSQDGLQSSFTSVTGPDPAQDFKSLGNIPSSQPLRSVGATALSGNGMMVHSPSHSQSQSRHTIGSPSLPPSSPLSGIQSSGGGGVPVPTIMPTVTGGTGSLSGTLGVNGQPGGVGMNPSTVGLVGGQGPGGIGAVHSGYNTSATTTLGGNNTMMGGSTQPLSTVNMGVGSPGQGPLAGLGGQGGLNSSNQMVQNALGLPGQTVMGSVGNTIGSSGTGPMMPTTGIPQSPGQGQAHAVNNAVVPAPLHAAATAGTPPQQSSTNSLKYTRLWDGILAGQRKGNAVPIPICKLEGYRQTSSPDTLAGDWPQTMQIMRLIPQEYMNQKDYQRKAELLVFRPLTPHDFLTQLAVKKLCAVIQLPTQTLLLASTDKPGRMIGMLFPGDMVQIKPQVSQQQAASAAMVPQGLAPNSFSQNQLQSQLQSQLPNSQLLQSQLPNQQLSSQQLSNQQLSNQQLSNQQLPNQQPRSQLLSGPASLHGVGFLP